MAHNGTDVDYQLKVCIGQTQKNIINYQWFIMNMIEKIFNLSIMKIILNINNKSHACDTAYKTNKINFQRKES